MFCCILTRSLFPGMDASETLQMPMEVMEQLAEVPPPDIPLDGKEPTLFRDLYPEAGKTLKLDDMRAPGPEPVQSTQDVSDPNQNNLDGDSKGEGHSATDAFADAPADAPPSAECSSQKARDDEALESQAGVML